jgi:hypothetical protein
MSGMAMVVVLGIVVLLSVVVAFAITMSGREQNETGKLVHNLSIQGLTESTLQRARNFFAANYGPNGNTLNSYLAYFVTNPVKLVPSGSSSPTYAQVNAAIGPGGTLTAAHPELINPNTPAGYACYMFVRDNVDEFPPLANNPSRDNDLLVFVGAVCAQTAAGGGSTATTPVVAELTAPLIYNNGQQYTSQAAQGSGNNAQ